MLQIERARPSEHTLRVDDLQRRRIADILADWLSMYAGVKPTFSREKFDLVVELRRVLLSPDENNSKGAAQ